MLVLVTGATGLLGRRVVQRLLEHHHNVRCLVHTPGGERVFKDRSLDIYYGSVTDPEALSEAFQGVDAVIHLVAIIGQRRNATFDAVNRQGSANVAAAAKQNSVKHFIHVSSNGATNDPRYGYLYSKWQGEQEVVSSGLAYTLFRPALMYGRGDEFLNTLAGLTRILPMVPVVGSGHNRFQPIDVDDVAKCLVLAVDRVDLKGKILEIGGPEQLSYNEILAIVARTLGKRRWRLHLPVWLMYLAAVAIQTIQPRPAITTEQLGMVVLRNVCESGVVEQAFGFTPKAMEGNIDFVKSVTASDGFNIALGLRPTQIRDH